MANDDFSEPPRRADSKISFSFFFADFWVWVTSEARGSVSVGFWGSRQLSLFGGVGGSSQGALSIPPPLQLKARLPQGTRYHTANRIQGIPHRAAVLPNAKH